MLFNQIFLNFTADGVTYSFGVFVYEFMQYYNEGSEAVSWIVSILVGVTLGSGRII